MRELIKKISARMPITWQQELKRRHYARQIHKGLFHADEPEYEILSEMVDAGDWVIDVGANIGHYTGRLSALVGATGRVLAFEPVPKTFELLAANSAHARHANISLFNAAVSEAQGIVGMEVPKYSTNGLDNPYQAHLTTTGSLKVLSLSIDALQIGTRIRLIKIDAEGHELFVIKGMRGILERDHPTLIVEGDDQEVEAYLTGVGYRHRTLPGSWNRIYSA